MLGSKLTCCFRLEEIQTIDSKIEPEAPAAEATEPLKEDSEAPAESCASDVDSDRPPVEVSEVGSSASTPAGTPNGNHRRLSSTRTQQLRRKSHPIAGAKQRALARNKAAEAKAAMAERRRMDEDVNKHERRLEAIERDFRKLLGIGRARPMGYDRFYNRIWWLEGLGGISLVGGGGAVSYGTGRIFVQGPSEIDIEVLRGRGEEVATRRQVEEGEDDVLEPGEWAYYDEVEQVSALLPTLVKKFLTLSSTAGRANRLAKSERKPRARSEEHAQ